MSVIAFLLVILSPTQADDNPPYDEPKNTPMEFTTGTGILSVQPIYQYGSNGETVLNGKLTVLDSGKTVQWRGALDVSFPTEALNKRELRTIDAVIGGRWKVSGSETYINRKDDENEDARFSRWSVGFDLLFSQETHEGEPQTPEILVGEIKESLLGLVASVGFTGLNIGRSQWNDRQEPKVSTFDVSVKAGVGNLLLDPSNTTLNVRKEVQGALFQARADYTDYDDGTGVYAQYTGLMVQDSSNDAHRYQVGAYFTASRFTVGGGVDLIYTDLGEVQTEVLKGFFSLGFKIF